MSFHQGKHSLVNDVDVKASTTCDHAVQKRLCWPWMSSPKVSHVSTCFLRFLNEFCTSKLNSGYFSPLAAGVWEEHAHQLCVDRLRGGHGEGELSVPSVQPLRSRQPLRRGQDEGPGSRLLRRHGERRVLGRRNARPHHQREENPGAELAVRRRADLQRSQIPVNAVRRLQGQVSGK